MWKTNPNEREKYEEEEDTKWEEEEEIEETFIKCLGPR